MRLSFTESALSDLDEIAEYIAQEHPERAVAFVKELVAVCQRLTLAPMGYVAIGNASGRAIRMRSHKRYLIFYTVTDETVEIVHVLHGSRDYAKILFPGEPDQQADRLDD